MDNSTYVFIKDIITFIFTATGLIIAGIGLATWKKQIKGTREFETAYNLHYSVLELRNAIKHVRNPAIFPSESQKAIEYSKNKYPDKLKEEIEKYSHSSVYEMRWEEIGNAFTKMESHLLAAEVSWGSDILNLIKPLQRKITELNIGLKQNFQPNLRTKNLEEIDNIIYDQSGENGEDGFSNEVNQAIQAITDYIKSKIY